MTAGPTEHLSGQQDIIDWFGRFPQFHDAELLRIELSSVRNSTMLIHAWTMTEVVNDEGFCVTDRHALVTINLSEISAIRLGDFHQPGIIANLEISALQSQMQISWTSSYGVHGHIVAGQISFELKPGKPQYTRRDGGHNV